MKLEVADGVRSRLERDFPSPQRLVDRESFASDGQEGIGIPAWMYDDVINGDVR